MTDNNQFDFMKSFMNLDTYMNSIKNLPPMDFASFSEVIKNATKILTTTNQMAVESMQSMIKKNSETFQNNATNLLNSAKDSMTSGDPQQMAECQKNCMKAVYNDSVKNATELANMASALSKDIFEFIHSNMSEQINKSCDVKKPKA